MSPEAGQPAGEQTTNEPADTAVLVTRVELETLVSRVEALEEALDALISRDR